jgi:hypothetical protein
MHKMAMGRMGFGGGGFGSHFGEWGGPCRAGDQPDEMESEFAKALGVTVEQLRNARETAFTNNINQAVADGELAPKQAERMRAWHSLRPYLNPKAIAARVLEMTPEQLQAAFDQGQTLWDLAAERHLDLPAAITKLRAAFQAIVQQAVADGAITQEQAAEIKQLRGRGFGPGPMGFLGHGGCGRGHGHGFPGMWGGPWQGGPEAGPDAPDAA